MRKCNKALASVLALVMAGSMLAGCGRETTGTPVDPNAGETEPVTTADPSTEPTEDEVYWFAIAKDGTYTYQLILKEGDWIAFCPTVGKMYGNQYFMNIGKDFGLPYKSGWKEETNGILSEKVL